MSLRETLLDARLSRQARKACRGDAEAFRGLYRVLHPVVWRYVSRRVGGRADVEDLVSRTFARMVEHLERFDPARGSVRAWSIGIARNAVIDHLRAQRGRGADAEAVERLADAALDPAGALEADERVAACLRCAACDPHLRDDDDLLLVAGMRTSQRATLHDAQIVTVIHGRTAAKPDDTIHLVIDVDKAHVFDGASGNRLA